MSEEVLINPNLSDEEKYLLAYQYLDGLIQKSEPKITALSNFCALLKQTFGKISWVGFYFNVEGILYLGPFQGKVACSQIKIGQGVCGTAAERNETIVVPDVNKFAGHIACDGGSKSEIVVPFSVNGNLFGVLDLDSYELAAFNEIDKKYLEKLVNLIDEKIDLSYYILS
jgi:GAF domain-containing protein